MAPKVDILEHTTASESRRVVVGPTVGHARTHLVRVLGARSAMSVSGRPVERIAKIAGAQRGRVARRQLVAGGISQTTITRLIARGHLLPEHRGVFVVGHAAPAELAVETAALLAMREGAVLSHHSAAAIWGIQPARSGDAWIHVSIRGGRSATVSGVRLHRSRILEPRDVRIHQGLPVTSPARTLLDQAAILTPRQLEFAFDQAVVSGTVRAAELSELLSRTAGRTGAPALAALIDGDRGAAVTRSEAEERFLALLRSAQLPEPEVNVRIHGYEVDFLWRRQRLVVEIDGYRYHSTRRAFEHDRRKDATMQAAGLSTMRITWRQLEGEPYAVVARLAPRLPWLD